MSQQTKTFQTEVKQVLDLVIHSLYSHADIFLRELVSNASDAIDRARFESLSNPTVAEPADGWRISLLTDAAAKTLLIRDNGIGMNAEELDKNLGTIASSGTKRFLEEARQAAAAGTPELIGQFGVGFYSAFMVADRVTVVTRKAGQEKAWKWESTGDGTYTVSDAAKDAPGTDITLHLKDDRIEYLDKWKIRELVKKYSNYIAFPIELDAAGAEKKPDDKPEVLNSTKAIWTRSRSEVKPEEYQEFYKGQFHDYREPLHVIPFSAEGVTEFRALLFIPSHAPWELFADPENRGLHLYVKRVFIMNNCPDLIPAWMRFVKGVVDSADLPLNVSREILQDSALVRRIQKSLVSRVLGELKDLKEKDAGKFRAFHKEFGRLLREGMHQDRDHQEKLKELLLFDSSAAKEGEPVFLKDYADRVQPDQKAVYYLCAPTRAAAEASPLLEPFRARRLEVLYFTDTADEYILPDLGEYAGRKFVSVQEGAKDLDTEEERKAKESARKDAEAKYGDLLKKVGELLKDDIREARFSDRLTDSACCLVAEDGLGPNMERFLRMQGGDMAGSPMFKRVLELNPAHPVLAKMESFRAENPDHPSLADYAALLRDQALLLEGNPAKEPARFARLVSALMVK